MNDIDFNLIEENEELNVEITNNSNEVSIDIDNVSKETLNFNLIDDNTELQLNLIDDENEINFTMDDYDDTEIRELIDDADGKINSLSNKVEENSEEISQNKADIQTLDNRIDQIPIVKKTSQIINDSGFITSEYHDPTKQDKLQSGVNIKTINNKSLLGSGNITIEGIINYPDLNNLPSINGVVLLGNRTSNSLGLQPAGNYALISQIPTTISQLSTDSSHRVVSDSQITYWNNKANTSDIPDVSQFITKNVNNLTYYTKTSDLGNVALTNNYNDLSNLPDLSGFATQSDLESEANDRENADINLQEQIDAITSSSDVKDVVGTYQQLLDYDTSTLGNNDIIKVLQDSTHNNAMTYYRWVITAGVGSWQYIGQEGAYYTKSETDALLNTKQNEITSSNKLLSDLVDDTNQNNLFVTSSEKTTWNNKQNQITSSNKLDSDLVDDTNQTNKFVTSQEKTTWNNKSDFSGDYDDLTNRPTNVSAFTNDAGYITQQDISGKYDKTGGEISGNVKIDGTLTLDIDDPDYDSGITFNKALDTNLGTVLTLNGYADSTNYKPIIRNVGTPNSNYDVANKKYVDDNVVVPTYHLVFLNPDGTVDTYASTINYNTIKNNLTDPKEKDYLDVVWNTTRFYAEVVEVTDVNTGDIKFITDVEYAGIPRRMVFTLNPQSVLTTTSITTGEIVSNKSQSVLTDTGSVDKYPSIKALEDFVKPVVIWESNTPADYLKAVQSNLSASPAWQLTDLDMTQFKRIKIYSCAGQKSGATASASTTPAIVLEMSLDSRNAISAYGGNYVGSTMVQKPNDANRFATLTCAVSADKTKFVVLRQTSLYGTAATSNNDVNANVFLIEGYYY